MKFLVCLFVTALCGAAAATEYADGKLGKALILDGSSHTVKIPHYAGLKPAKAITISAWIKPERVGVGGWAWQQISRKEEGDARAFKRLASTRRSTASASAWGSAGNTSNMAGSGASGHHHWALFIEDKTPPYSAHNDTLRPESSLVEFSRIHLQ